MKNLLLFRLFSLHGYRSFWVIVVVAATLLPTVSAAQDTPAEARIGFYLSGSGIVDNLNWGPIKSPDDDVMPYPDLFFSLSLNRKYKVVIGWGNDNLNKEHTHADALRHNEHIAIFSARYNYYPFKKVLYAFGGPVIWYFNKEFSFTESICIGDGRFEGLIKNA